MKIEAKEVGIEAAEKQQEDEKEEDEAGSSIGVERSRNLFSQRNSRTVSTVKSLKKKSVDQIEQNGELSISLRIEQLFKKQQQLWNRVAPEASEMKRRPRTSSVVLVNQASDSNATPFATQVRVSRGAVSWLLQVEMFVAVALLLSLLQLLPTTTCYRRQVEAAGEQQQRFTGNSGGLQKSSTTTVVGFIKNGNLEQPLLLQRKRRFTDTDSARVAGEPPANNRTPTSLIRNVSATNGQSVLLHCQVEPSADVIVSWFRGAGEPQLLTYMSDTIIPDERFVVRHNLMKDNDWALQIKNLDKSTDSGLYQCQTNSDPPQSQYYQLSVVEPQVNILGAPDLAVKLGAAINLTCVISQSPDQLQFVFWYRDQRMINFDITGERGKIVMWKSNEHADTMISNLQIFSSRLSDSGNYTCMPSGARPMSVHVHVLEGASAIKRLIMFQNDFVVDPSTAASSQQTNSAFSVHVVRLSRGRAYALFVAFLIFASWFHLLLQVQTAISLLLLAIIGYLLGRINDNSAEESAATPTAALSTAANKQPPVYLSVAEKGYLAKKDRRRSTTTTTTSSDLLNNFNDTDEEDVDDRKSSPQHLAQKRNKAPLTSPSGQSTGSSSTSTGYNSDTRSTNLTPATTSTPIAAAATETITHHTAQHISGDTCRQVQASSSTCDDNHDEIDEMIELVSQPTALRLIMDEFSSPRATPLEPYYSSPAPSGSIIPCSEAQHPVATPSSGASPATSPR